jgi:hypothetical protein
MMFFVFPLDRSNIGCPHELHDVSSLQIFRIGASDVFFLKITMPLISS